MGRKKVTRRDVLDSVRRAEEIICRCTCESECLRCEAVNAVRGLLDTFPEGK